MAASAVSLVISSLSTIVEEDESEAKVGEKLSNKFLEWCCAPVLKWGLGLAPLAHLLSGWPNWPFPFPCSGASTDAPALA